MRKVILSLLLVLGTQLLCPADTWSDMLRAYKMDLSTLARGNGYQIFRSEAGGLGVAYSETDPAGQCHFSLAMVPIKVQSMRWLPSSGASFLEVKDPYGHLGYLGILGLQEVEGPASDPKLGSFSYVIEPTIYLGYAENRRILNLAFYGDQMIVLVNKGNDVLWVDVNGKKVVVPEVDTPSTVPAETLLIEDTRAVDIGLSVFWADRNVGADAPQAYGDYVAFGSPVPWGGAWRTPSYRELEELVKKCSWELSACDGVTGYKVTGPNGNAIFLPLGGAVWGDGTLYALGDSGAIWSSERVAERYYLENNYKIFLQMTQSSSEKYRHYIRSYNLYKKMSLRPVMAKAPPALRHQLVHKYGLFMEEKAN